MKTIFQPTDCLSLQELESYHRGELPGKAIRKVETHLVDCPLCSGALEGLNNSLQPSLDRKQIRSLPYGKQTKLFKPSRVAAIFLIGIMVAAALYFRPTQSAATLFSTHYQPPQPPHIQLRGNTPTAAQASIAPALVAFQQQDHKKSISLLAQHLKTYPDDPNAHFWQGIAYLEINDPNSAITALQLARTGREGLDKRTGWYLLMAHLQNEDTASALRLSQELMSIADTEYANSLKTIQKKLGRLSGQ